MNRPISRGLSVLAAAGALVCAAAAPALAHVTVNPSEAEQGDFTVLDFRVPNERDDASTVELSVQFPADQPIESVSVRPHAGWSYEITRAPGSEAVSVVTWRAADGAEIKPGEYDEFAVSAGPLPEVDRLLFPALQTYSNGEIVRWIDDPPVAGGEAPDRPAPVLRLTTAAEPVENPGSEPADSADSTARWLSGAALVAGLAAGLLAVLALRRTGSR